MDNSLIIAKALMQVGMDMVAGNDHGFNSDLQITTYHDLALEVHSLHHHVRYVSNRDLIFLPN